MSHYEEPREQVFDETFKHLERKDHRTIAEFLFPPAIEAQSVSLESIDLPMADLRRADFIARVTMEEEDFLLHVEFEAFYNSNREMHKKMLRYHVWLRWHSDLPIYQILVILKEPTQVRSISSRYTNAVMGEQSMEYAYKAIKIYEYDKYATLRENKPVLIPLRVFMKHPGETDQQHIQECLRVAESLDDKDFYFLTQQCLRKLYQKSQYESYVKEEILMKSSLYREPFEKGWEQGLETGLEKGMEKGMVKGRISGISELLWSQIMKKFPGASSHYFTRLEELDSLRLKKLGEELLNIQSLSELDQFLKNDPEQNHAGTRSS